MKVQRSYAARRATVFSLACLLSIGTSALADTQYEYDPLGRLISVTYSDGKQIIYKYDPAGNRTEYIVSATTLNRQPVTAPDAITINEGASQQFDPRTNDSDPDSQALTIVGVAPPPAGTASVVSGGQALNYVATTSGPSVVEFAYTIEDTADEIASGLVVATVNNVNPVAVTDPVSVAREGIVTFNARQNDTDPGGDALTITGVTQGTKGAVTLLSDGAQIKYDTNNGATGSDSFTYTLSDGDGGTATGTVNMTLINQSPTAVADAKTAIANSTIGMDLRANDSDPEQDSFTITAKTNGTLGTVSINTGGLSVNYLAPSGASGTDNFNYTITDALGATAQGSVTVTVRMTNAVPVATADSVTVPFITGCMAMTFNPLWNDTDADGDPITISSNTNPNKGTVTRTTTQITYTPTTLNNNQSDSFTYRITDGLGGISTPKTISVTCSAE